VIATAQIRAKNGKGVEGSGGHARDDNDVALEKAVGLVGRMVVRKNMSQAGDRGAQDAFASRAKRRIVVVNELAQAVEGEETTDGQRKEEKIVVRRRGERAQKARRWSAVKEVVCNEG
jgi:hypothetical protein